MGTSVTIHWCCFVPSQEDLVKNALLELSRLLQGQYSQIPRIQITKNTLEESSNISSLLRSEGGFLEPDSKSALFDNKRVFIFCDEHSDYAKYERSKNPKALWGAAVRRKYALAWKQGNKFLIWHETMHLLGADDCYDESGKGNCSESQCIMQYAPGVQTCGNRLALCNKNVQLIN